MTTVEMLSESTWVSLKLLWRQYCTVGIQKRQVFFNYSRGGTMAIMIRTLTGVITNATETTVVVDVRGVGYLVGTPNRDNSLRVDDSVTLHTYLAVRETALRLFLCTGSVRVEGQWPPISDVRCACMAGGRSNSGLWGGTGCKDQCFSAHVQRYPATV